MTLQEWVKQRSEKLVIHLDEGFFPMDPKQELRRKDIQIALLEAAEKITEEVIQILNDEPDLRMDELVSLKRKVFQIMERP